MRANRLALASAVVALLASVLAQGGAAQTGGARLPPLPIKEKGFPRTLAPVVEAEHAFAQYSIDHGMKEAFLRFAAPDGVVFRRGPVNAVEAWTQTNPAPTGLLTWWPAYADVSGAGDLGYTTGPYELRENPSDEKPGGTGHYFTVWRRQPDGSWKFVLDLGIRHPAPASPETTLGYPSWLKNARVARAADAGAARQTLLEAEHSLSDTSSKEGVASALPARADETVRLYRQGRPPAVGRESVRAALGGANEFVTWKLLKSDVASSGDLGYSYGTYESRAKPSDEGPAEQGNYARVWRRRGGAWRVVMDVTNPVRPQGQ